MSEDQIHLYIIQCGCSRYHKIGVSTYPGDRLEALQTANPMKLSLRFAIAIPNESAIERYLHKKYQKQNIRGEWFDLSENDVASIRTYIKSLFWKKVGRPQKTVTA